MRFKSLVGVVVAVSLTAGEAQAQTQYVVTPLGTLGGTQSQASGINASGQVVGCAGGNSGGYYYAHAFLYSNGTTQDLGTLSGFSESYGYGINSSGQVVGYASTGNTNTYYCDFLYTGGTMQYLATLQGFRYSCAYGINDSGQVIGISTNHLLVETGPVHGFLYSNGAMQDLGSLGGTQTWPRGINASGQVVGYADTGSATDHAFLYSNGTMQDLGTLSGFSGSHGWGINANGQVVGEAYTINNSGHAFLYSNGTMQDLGTLGGAQTCAYGINASGQIVGKASNMSGWAHAFIYSNGTMQDLNNLVAPQSSGWTIACANAINDNGWIAATGRFNGGNSMAVLLTPIPEPAILSLLAFGVLAMLRRRN